MSELVSIVTATWGRPRAILRHAVPSVLHQTYRPLEHIIVMDGFDPDLKRTLEAVGYTSEGTESDGVTRRLAWVGRNWTGLVRDAGVDAGIGSAPRAVGGWMASGKYICYFDDDNDFTPDHVELLVNAMEEQGVDVVLTPWEEYPNPGQGVADTNTFMHKAEVLRFGSWELSPYNADYCLVRNWIDNHNVRWGFHEKQTVTLNRLNGGKGAPE